MGVFPEIRETTVQASLADSIEQFDHCLTVPELARILRIHPITLYRAAQSGRLPSFRINSAVRLDPRAVATWLRQRGGAL
jgi:excisionase family DNA binding protein